MVGQQIKLLKQNYNNLFFSVDDIIGDFVTFRIDGRKFVSKLQTHTMLTLTNVESITSIFHELIQLSRYNSSDNFLIFLPKSHISVNIDTFNHTKRIDFSYLVFNVSKLLCR